MSPPKLAADTPVFDIFQPVFVGVLVFGRIEFQFIIHYRRQCHVCKMLHLQEPLHGQFRFDGYIGTFRETYLISISFYLFQQSGSLQVLFNLFTYIKTVHTYIQSGSFAQCSVIIEDINAGQVIFFAKHIVIHIMGGCYFQTSCTKFNVYVVVFDNRNDTVYQWYNYLFAFQPLVFRVIGIDTHGSISHNCFGTSGSNYRIASFSITFYFVTEIIQFAVFFLINNFFITESCQCFWVPVYHAYTAIDQTFVVKVYEYFDDTFATFFVHGECCTVPIAGCT